MTSTGRGTSGDSQGKPYRVGFPDSSPPVDRSGWKFPVLDRALAVSDKIRKMAGQRGWKTVLDAVRQCEAAEEGFESLPQKVKQLILDAEKAR